MSLFDDAEAELERQGTAVYEPTPPHIALKNFSVQIGTTLATFRSGAVITDQMLIANLKLASAPIEEVGPGLIVCPHCAGMFRPMVPTRKPEPEPFVEIRKRPSKVTKTAEDPADG